MRDEPEDRTNNSGWGDHVRSGDLVFDDEPLDAVLYGRAVPAPTPATVDLPIKQRLREARALLVAKDPGLALALEWVDTPDLRLSRTLQTELVKMLSSLVPQVPRAIVAYDLAKVEAPLRRLRALAELERNDRRQLAVDSILYRLLEHRAQYAGARQLLTGLIEDARRRGHRADEALYTNNHAFEFLLEGRWAEAVPGFERAARLFGEAGQPIERSNVRANYWWARFEVDGGALPQDGEEEIHDITRSLEDDRDWRARKALVLAARLAEQRGDMATASRLVGRAIDVTEARLGIPTAWPGLDRAYLAGLPH